jgi:uncharacterized protein (DUF433 family)
MNVMTALDRITFDPTRMNGQACIRDLRLLCAGLWKPLLSIRTGQS